MRKHLSLLLLAVAAAGSASADTIIGSFVISSLGATINGTNLANSTLFTPAGIAVGLGPTGSFAGLAGETGTGAVIDTTAINSFGVSFSFGDFAAATGLIVQQSANFLDVFYVGTFTGAGVLAGDSGPASVRVSINQSGASISYGGTLAAPPVDTPDVVPEPTTYALVGASLLGLAALRRRVVKV